MASLHPRPVDESLLRHIPPWQFLDGANVFAFADLRDGGGGYHFAIDQAWEWSLGSSARVREATSEAEIADLSYIFGRCAQLHRALDIPKSNGVVRAPATDAGLILRICGAEDRVLMLKGGSDLFAGVGVPEAPFGGAPVRRDEDDDGEAALAGFLRLLFAALARSGAVFGVKVKEGLRIAFAAQPIAHGDCFCVVFARMADEHHAQSTCPSTAQSSSQKLSTGKRGEAGTDLERNLGDRWPSAERHPTKAASGMLMPLKPRLAMWEEIRCERPIIGRRIGMSA